GNWEDEMKTKWASLCVAGALATFVGGSTACDPVVVVNYTQLGACQGSADGLQGVGPNLALVFFRIDGVANSTSASFRFDPFHLEVPTQVANNPPPDGKINELLTGQWSSALGLPAAAPVTLAPGAVQASPQLGVMLVATDAKDGATEAAGTSYFLT